MAYLLLGILQIRHLKLKKENRKDKLKVDKSPQSSSEPNTHSKFKSLWKLSNHVPSSSRPRSTGFFSEFEVIILFIIASVCEMKFWNYQGNYSITTKSRLWTCDLLLLFSILFVYASWTEHDIKKTHSTFLRKLDRAELTETTEQWAQAYLLKKLLKTFLVFNQFKLEFKQRPFFFNSYKQTYKH